MPTFPLYFIYMFLFIWEFFSLWIKYNEQEGVKKEFSSDALPCINKAIVSFQLNSKTFSFRTNKNMYDNDAWGRSEPTMI